MTDAGMCRILLGAVCYKNMLHLLHYVIFQSLLCTTELDSYCTTRLIKDELEGHTGRTNFSALPPADSRMICPWL